MQSTVDRQADGTIQITISIPWGEITKAYDKSVDELVQHVEIKGFRKGKAPRDLAEKELDKNKVYEEAIKQIVPTAYAKTIKDNSLKPIMQPDIQLGKAKEGEAWEVMVQTCERPKFDFTKYKDLIKKAKGEIKKDELWIPGKSQPETEKDEQSLQQKRQKQLNTILEYLIKHVDITIPGIMLKSEVDARLSRLVDEISKLGLTIETYSKSKNVTPEVLRKQQEMEVINTFKLEFILEELANIEKITVGDKEIDATIAKLTDAKERAELEKNKYYMANLLRRQKTLDRLLSL